MLTSTAALPPAWGRGLRWLSGGLSRDGVPPVFAVPRIHRAFLMRNSEADKTFSYRYFARFLADLTCLQLFFIALRSHRKADPRSRAVSHAEGGLSHTPASHTKIDPHGGPNRVMPSGETSKACKACTNMNWPSAARNSNQCQGSRSQIKSPRTRLTATLHPVLHQVLHSYHGVMHYTSAAGCNTRCNTSPRGVTSEVLHPSALGSKNPQNQLRISS